MFTGLRPRTRLRSRSRKQQSFRNWLVVATDRYSRISLQKQPDTFATGTGTIAISDVLNAEKNNDYMKNALLALKNKNSNDQAR